MSISSPPTSLSNQIETELLVETQGFSQMGGHGDLELCFSDKNYILKPLLRKDSRGKWQCNVFERDFYLRASCIMEGMIPRFHALEIRRLDKPVSVLIKGKVRTIPEMQLLELENLTSGFDNPNIMDLKVGFKHWNAYCSQEKVARKKEKANRSTVGTLGLKLCGMEYTNGDGWRIEHGKKFYKKEHYNSGVPIDKVSEFATRYLAEFFQSDVVLINSCVSKLEEFRKRLKEIKLIRLYSSSLLFIYDKTGKIDLRIIDFSRSIFISPASLETGETELERTLAKEHPPKEHQNYLRALDNAIEALKYLL
jgi:hypothetical protein